MSDALDFSLPTPPRRESRFGRLAVAGLLVALTGLIVVDVWFSACERDATPTGGAGGLDAEQTRALATKLGQRQLHDRAAITWEAYASRPELEASARARALFQAGLAWERSGDYSRAVESFYRSETVAPVESLAPEIKTHVKDCFERLGKFAALRYEVMDRTGYRPRDAADANVVAEIGPQRITRADLLARIEEQIDQQLAPMRAFLPEADLRQQQQRLLDQYQSAQAQQGFLQQWLGREVLYREALEQNLAQKDEVKSLLDELTRGVLAEQFLNQQLAAKIHITEGDLRTYYQAHHETYRQPAEARLRHIRLAERSAAEKLIEKLQAGADFAAMAREYSQAPDANETGGALAEPAIKGQAVPGLGGDPNLTTAIFAAQAPAVLDRPFRSDGAWEIVQVESLTPSRQKPFEEVQQEILGHLTAEKRREVQEDLVTHLRAKYEVTVHPSAWPAASPTPAPTPAP